jgi:hypothetical protein
MRALNGGLEPDMTFTLCNTNTVGLILYMRETKQETPEQFRAYCVLLKKGLLEIADLIAYLVQESAIRTIPRNREEPPNIPEQWRRYTDFTPEERKVLKFAGSVRMIPRLSLYRTWEAMHHETIIVQDKIPEVVL